jgi:hypothetical protein
MLSNSLYMLRSLRKGENKGEEAIVSGLLDQVVSDLQKGDSQTEGDLFHLWA